MANKQEANKQRTPDQYADVNRIYARTKKVGRMSADLRESNEN